MHVPALTNVILDPLTVHTGVVDEVSVTGSPELAVAVTVSGDWSMVEFGGFANVMVCVAWVTLNERVTGVAGR